MGKHTIKFKCGHVKTVTLDGPKRLQFRKAYGWGMYCICKDCYRAEHTDYAESDKRMDELTQRKNLPPLRGTLKQIQWGKKLRVEMIERVESSLNWEAATPLDRDVLHAFYQQDEARYWIDNRSKNTTHLFSEMYEKFMQGSLNVPPEHLTVGLIKMPV